MDPYFDYEVLACACTGAKLNHAFLTEYTCVAKCWLHAGLTISSWLQAGHNFRLANQFRNTVSASCVLRALSVQQHIQSGVPRRGTRVHKKAEFASVAELQPARKTIVFHSVFGSWARPFEACRLRGSLFLSFNCTGRAPDLQWWLRGLWQLSVKF
jgi:hypothetical protein